MTETPEPTTATVVEPVVDRHPHGHRPNRLYQAAAWVAIVAGVVFIVGAVFFTGFTLGRHSGPDGGMGGGRHGSMMGGHRPDGGGMMMPRPPMGDRDEMGPAMMGPGMMGPGMMGPGAPGVRGPGAAPTTSTPAPAPNPAPPSR